MKNSRLTALIGIAMLGATCGPAAAHRPHFLDSAPISAEGYPAAQIKLLIGDGIIGADPIRAVVIGRNGELLAASPIAQALQLSCDDQGRQCQVYDDVTFKIYEPSVNAWQDRGLIEQDGEPRQYPEDIDGDFGFVGRQATFAEIARFEAKGLVSSWMRTGWGISWWLAFWWLLLSVVRDIFGKTRPITIARIARLLGRTVVALLMIPLTAYGWLISPYSLIYLCIVLMAGAALAFPIAFSAADDRQPGQPPAPDRKIPEDPAGRSEQA